MLAQIRIYTINRGEIDNFLANFKEVVMPLHEKIGLPIVATRCEGAEELMGDNGIVVKQGGAKAIADAVRSLAGSRQRYEQMSKAARSRAERFSWKSVAEKYLSCYNAVMNSLTGHRA